MTTVLLVVLILIVLIVVHEFGHFIAAKLFGVRVDEFGIGYPPRAFLFGKWRGTEYTLNWIPFGGFVRLFGEDGEASRVAHGRGSFADAPRSRQALILIAGVTMNALAAYLLFAGAYASGIMHAIPDSEIAVRSDARLIITSVVDGSPADAAGLEFGDEIITLRDNRGAELRDPTPDSLLNFVSARGGEELTVTYLHANATSSAVLRPAHAVVAEESGRPAIGVGTVMVSEEALPIGDALREAYYQLKSTFVVVVSGLWTLISNALGGEPNLREVVGPVGLVGVVGEAAENGWGYVLFLAGFISVNLVIINLIPIPALDGGRLLVVAIEALARRTVPKLLMQTFNMIGVALIILLMITVTYNDVARLLA